MEFRDSHLPLANADGCGVIAAAGYDPDSIPGPEIGELNGLAGGVSVARLVVYLYEQRDLGRPFE